jgi:hypothetical protein
MSAMRPYPVAEKSLDVFLQELADHKDPRLLEDKSEDWLEYMDHLEDRLSDAKELAAAKARMHEALTPMIEAFISRPEDPKDKDGSKLKDLEKAHDLVDLQYFGSQGEARVQAHARMACVVKAAYLLGTPKAQKLSKDAFDWQVDQLLFEGNVQQGLMTIGNQIYGHPKSDPDRVDNAGYEGKAAKNYRHPTVVLDRMAQFLQSSDLVVGKQGLLVARGDAIKP